MGGTWQFLWARWIAIPYTWRRRLVIGAIVWIVFRILAWQLGFETLVVYLLLAVAATYVIAELGVRRLIPAYVWFYRQFTGQLLGVVFAVLLPIIAESWTRAVRLHTGNDVLIACATTLVIAYLWWVMRRAVFSPVENYRFQRERVRRRRR